MRAVTKTFTTGGIEVEIVSDHGQPIARLWVEPKTMIPRDVEHEHFAVRYSLRGRATADEEGIAFISSSKADRVSVPRQEP